MALPFIQVLHQKYPESKIIVIGKSWVIPVYKNNPHIDQIIEFSDVDLKSFRGTFLAGKRLKQMGFDKIYLLTNSLRSAIIAWTGDCNERIGYASQGRSVFLTSHRKKSSENIHRSKSFINLILPEANDFPLPEINVDQNNFSPNLAELAEVDINKAIAVFPGSVASSRNIPSDIWIEILKYPVKEGRQIIIIGGRSDIKTGDEIQSFFSKDLIINTAGKFSLEESIALISKCGGSIASDSGLGHISAAVGIKTVSLFGAGDPQITSPRGQKAVWVNAGVECSPCNKNICINEVEPLLCMNQLIGRKIWENFISV